MKTEIQTKSDIQKVVDLQYAELLKNDETAHLFSHLNLVEHMPKIYVFWCFILDVESNENRYTGSAFEPHVKLNLTKRHFELWLQYLHKAIQDNYTGEIAQKWIEKSNQLGLMFQYKMGLEDYTIPVKKP